MKAKYKIWDYKKKQFISPAMSKYDFIYMDDDGDLVEVGVCESELCTDENRDLIPILFTGLLDKNNNAIYKGCFVNAILCIGGDRLPITGEIEYNKEYAAYCIENEAGQTLLHNISIGSLGIIGNIYEHPHLLNPKP